MSGPGNALNTQNSITQQQLGLAQQEQQQSQVQYEKMQELEAPSIALNQGIISGDKQAQQTAFAPFVQNITANTNATKERIMNSLPPGAARDTALAQIPVQQGAQVSTMENSTILGAYDKLANIGAGLGSFSLQQLGASLSGFGGASNSNQSVIQAGEQSKASTMGILGSLFGAAGTAAGGGAFGHL